MKIQIPFTGFYESIHDINYDFLCEVLEKDHDDIDIDFKKYANDYSCEYVNKFICHHGLDDNIQFHSVSSPREYNFETDTILADITISGFDNILDTIDISGLNDYIVENLTPRSGFMPYYSNNVNVWIDDIADYRNGKKLFDSVQAGIFLQVFTNHQYDDDVSIADNILGHEIAMEATT